MQTEPNHEIIIGRWGRWSIRTMPGAEYNRREPLKGTALVYDPEEDFTWFPLGDVVEEWFENYLAPKLRSRPGSLDGLADALATARTLVAAAAPRARAQTRRV